MGGPEKDRFNVKPIKLILMMCSRLCVVRCVVTGLVPSETACLANSPGSKSLTAV